jgi:hypothetical protein
MKFLGLFLTLVALSASAAETPPALYSFNDVYRLTVGQPPRALEPGAAQPTPAAEAQPRAVAVETAAAEPRFTVRPLLATQPWLLALAGLLLAGWVAHRRLSYL